MKKFYITTPIYYVNDSPHIGHAYTTIAADSIARFKRLDGYDVHFLTGTDDHGQKIEKAAVKAGISPKEYTDKIAQRFVDLTKDLCATNDDFIRTSEPRHKEFVQNAWLQIYDKGYIYKGTYSGWYAVRDECFYKEDEIQDGKAPTGAEVEWVKEESYFFALSKFQDKLLEFYEKNPDFIGPPSRMNEVKAFVQGGLQDLSLSRTSFSWGIPVPNDNSHVIYVWFDALFNYLSGIQSKQGFWPCDLHIIGKDILRFHAVYWPAFLMALGAELPKRIFAHGWWLNDGEKISKSLGNVINPAELINEFGLDYVRYFMLKEVAFGSDGNYSRANLVSRINAELVNNIGNLVQRVSSFVYKNCGGAVPTPHDFIGEDKELITKAYETIVPVRQAMEVQALSQAIENIISLATAANIYVDSQAPWKLRKENPERMETVLFTLLETIRVIGVLLKPFTPDAAQKILGILNVPDHIFANLSEEYKLKPGNAISEPSPVFPRLQL